MVTVNSIETMCMFQVGQCPAQYGVQVKEQALPMRLCAPAARCCRRASGSGAPVWRQLTVSALAMLAEDGTATVAPASASSSISSTSSLYIAMPAWMWA